MDDLVLIILTLLVAAIGIIGQTKKRKEANQRPQPGKSPQNFWDLLETQMEPPPQMVDVQTEYNMEDEPVDIVPKTPNYEFDSVSEGKSDLKAELTQNISADEKSGTKREKFPLKKAVIYSEILNRKYI